MQEERGILGFLSEALSFELGSSTSIDAVTDHWDHIHSLGDNDLHDYMIANPEPSHEEQHDLHSEASSSGTKNEATSSHSEQRRNEDSEQPPSAPNQHVQNSNPPALSVPPFQWTEVSLADGSSTSTVPPVERNLHLDETRPRSIPESPLFIPAPELRNATSGDLNVASAVSRTGSATGVQPPSYQNLPHQQRRRSELARRSLISSLAGSGDHPTLGASPDGLVLQPGGDRQGDGVAGAHHSFRALAAASRGRSSRLTVSQNILDVMRRDPNHNLRLEDVMLLNQSLLFDGAGGMHDRYRDMRLDVDNMSYEELLALEERIGDVCTGVNEETISNRLKQRKFKSSTKSPQDAEPCCICQEEYSEGEDMGALECGHDFHSQCIKEWLKQKNLCPICKTTGLNTAKKRKIG
ncbi:probable E3 ubiquitin-protein ligase RHG1A isoform X2 [Brassica napus]|uniref:probable E3 ubiquitin-protein ligase RHG1A isoform X2 n=1 Tax=Brassica napus TaxID=3708 RepID=UPI0020790A14|nr:probable E3 ubiquitin-protein ligase RHG1A isoform X2 [Brassica napus]